MNYKNYSLSKILYGGSSFIPELSPRVEQIIKLIREERGKLIECNRKIAQIKNIKDKSNALIHKHPNSLIYIYIYYKAGRLCMGEGRGLSSLSALLRLT